MRIRPLPIRPLSRLCTVALSAALGVCVLAAPAAEAQQTISEFFSGGQILFCDEDVAALDRATELSDDQKEAIRLLMRGAAEQARRVWMRGQREVAEKLDWRAIYYLPDEDRAEQYAEYYSAWMKEQLGLRKKITDAELETLRDVRSLLTPEQIEKGWPRFERERRRLLVRSGFAGNLGSDPRDLVLAAKLDAADAAAAEPILTVHDEQIDVLIIRRLGAIVKMNHELARTGKYEETDGSQNGPDLMNREIQQLNSRAAADLERVVSEGGKQRLLRMRVGLELGNEFTRPSLNADVQQLLLIPTLTSDQKQQMKETIKAADAVAFDLAVACLRAGDEIRLRPDANPEEPPQNRIERNMRTMGETTRGLVKNLRKIATAEQLDTLSNGSDYAEMIEREFKNTRRCAAHSPWIDDDKEITPEIKDDKR